MASSTPKFIICYSLGVGAGFDTNLACIGRQLCEDLAELLALNEEFITIPQMVVIHEADELVYSPEKNACAFAVFYSLPETQWIFSATRAIGGDIALTGRITDDESGLILSINLVDIHTKNLLFCGYESCTREEIHLALERITARILAHFTDISASSWLPQIHQMVGTSNFHAYSNWMNMREIERRAQREGTLPSHPKLVECLTYAIQADPNYTKACLKLCSEMAYQLPRQSYEFILRYLETKYHHNEALSLIVVQSLARLGRRSEAESCLNQIIEKHPQNGLFWLIRGSLRTDERLAARDLDEAKHLLGNDFNGCRSAVDNALLNVTGV